MTRRELLPLALACAAAALPVAPGCLLLEALEDREDAAVYSDEVVADSQSCGVRGFAYFVRPQIRAACASCHSGSGPGVGGFAAYDLTVGYGAAKSRASMSNPSGSLLVQRSSEANHGGACSTCGSSWGATLSAAISQWSEAEANTPSLCDTLPAAGGTVDEFDDGSYSPGAGVEVVIIPAGLAKFSESGGVHEILKVNCAECHDPGRAAGFAPFGQDDATEAYKAAKPRMNFADSTQAKLLNRAGSDSHCGVCGDSGLVASLGTELAQWQAAEVTGAVDVRVKLDDVAINLPTQGTSRTISWNLGTALDPANPALAGAEFRIDVERPSGSSLAFVYRVRNPRIVAAGTAIAVQDIRFVLNGVDDPLIATYSTVNATAPASQTTVLSGSVSLIPIVNTGTDTIGFSFFRLAP